MGDLDANSGPTPPSSGSNDQDLSREVVLQLQVSLETIGNLSFLAHESAEYPEKTRSYLRMLDEQVQRMGGVMRKILQPPTGQ